MPRGVRLWRGLGLGSFSVGALAIHLGKKEIAFFFRGCVELDETRYTSVQLIDPGLLLECQN